MLFVLLSALLAAEPQPASNSTAWRAAFLLTRAGDAFANKRYDESEQLFKSLLKLEPENETAFIHLAAIANKRNDRQAAATYLLTGVKAHPKSFAIVHELGIALNALGRAKDAVPYLRIAVELEPRSFDARMNLGDAYAQTGQFDEALVNYEQALAVQGDNPVALRQAGYAAFRKGDGNRAVRYLELAKKQLPTEWTVWMTLGHALAAMGNDASALQAYETVIKLAPKQSAAYSFAGNMLDRQNKGKEAEARYREAIKVDPRDALARVHLGNLMRKDGRTIQAQKEYEAALRTDPRQIWALTQLGFLLYEKHDNKAAEKLLQQALAIAPNDNDVEVTLGDLYALRGKTEEAEVRFRRVLNRSATHLGALVKLADSLQRRGKEEQARQLYSRAVTAHPKSAWALIAYGDSLRAIGKHQEAEQRYRQALEADPLSMWAVRQLGYVRFELKRYEEALASLKQAAGAYPEEVGVPLVMGHSLRALGQATAARQYYDRAARIDAKNPIARMFLAVAMAEDKRFADAVSEFQLALALDPKLFEGWVLLGDVATQAAVAPASAASQPTSQPASQPASLASTQPAALQAKVRSMKPAYDPLKKPASQPASAPTTMADVARGAYERALALKPGEAWPTRQLGYLEFLTGNVDRAATLLSSVAKLYPDDVEIPLIQGHSAKKAKKWVDAKQFYERARDIAPNDARTHVFLATTLREMGDLRGSHLALLQAVEVAPEMAWAHYERALTLFELRRFPQAALAAEKATQLDRNARDPWLFLGRLRHLSRKHDAAVRAYAEATRIDAEYVPGQLGYAGALMHRGRSGDVEEAADRVQRAVNAQPNDAFTQLVTGVVFTRLYEKEKAKEKIAPVKLLNRDVGLAFADIAALHLEKAVALAPADQTTRLSVATSLVLLDRFKPALATLEPLLAQGRTFCPAREWEVTWQMEQTKVEALLTPRSVEEQRLLPQRDRVAIAYMLSGDIANKEKDLKRARLAYACSAAIQPERPEAHLQLGFAYEADAFYRLAEEHYVIAQKLAALTIDRALHLPAKKPLAFDFEREDVLEMYAAAGPVPRKLLKQLSGKERGQRAAAPSRSAPASDRTLVLEAQPSSTPASLPAPRLETATPRPAREAEALSASRPSSEPSVPLPASLPSSRQVRGTAPAPIADEVPVVDDERIAELRKFEATATEAVGRLRKEAGIPVLPWLRLAGETAFESQPQGPEVMARLGMLLRQQRNADGTELTDQQQLRGLETLALTVPRQFYTLVAAAAKPTDYRVVPRFELQYKFFREEGTFFNDRQTIESRLGHVITAGAAGVIPMKIAESELRYWAEERITIADSPSRGEIRADTNFRARFTQFKLGAADAQIGYEYGGFNWRPGVVSFATPQDAGAHTLHGVLRVEPQLRKLKIETGAEYRFEQTFLAPSGKRVWNNILALDVGSRLGDWIVQGFTRFGFAGTDYIAATIPTIFCYNFKVRGAYLLKNYATFGGNITVAGVPGHNVFDTFSTGIDADYRIVWPNWGGHVHTGFHAWAAYDIRVAYNVVRVDHVFTLGLSFAR